MEDLKKVKRVYSEKGALEVIRRACKKVFRLVLETNSATWYVRNLDSSGVQVQADIPLNIDFYDFEGTLNWIRDQNISWMLNVEELEVAIAEGHYWANAKVDGAIIAYTKVGFGRVHVNDYRKAVEFPKDTAFLYDSYVLPEFRGKKVVPCLMNEACLLLASRGFRKVLGYVPEWNTSSIKSVKRVGLKQARKIRYLRILGFRILTGNPSNL